MKTRPIQPARISFGTGADEPPSAPDFADTYHPRVGALAQARHVFLHGNGLPARWAGRRDFTVLETGFGLGNNFLALWQAWREDKARCDRLHVVSIELHPPARDDLARAHAASPLPDLAAQLVHAWPPLTPGLHRLVFDGGHVQLTLALGDVQALLPQLRLSADALFLDGFAPARNAAMWSPEVIKALARRCAPGATAATWSAARGLHAALVTAGFEPRLAPGIGGKREITLARFAPRHAVRRAPDPAIDSDEAVVVGAGLAGAAVALALARRGIAVTVLEQAGAAAQGASGNPAGLFHGTLDADDSPYARLHRAAALSASAEYASAIAQGVAGAANGLLRLAPAGADQPGLPRGYVRWLARDEASDFAGVPLPQGAWLYPHGGWLAPAAWVTQALSHPGITLRSGCAVHAFTRAGECWSPVSADGRPLARTRLLVLAAAAGTEALCAALATAASGTAGAPAPWPLHRTRGQVTHWRGASPLRLPLAGDGYAIPLPDGLLCGATRTVDDDAAVRDADHQHNLQRLARLTGLAPPPGTALQARVGWRLHSEDRLPIAGPLPAWVPDARSDQARLLPRERGVFVCTALGARGITWAPLLGELIAAQATGTPWPLEQDLVDALDPGRWRVRSARRERPQRG